MSLVLGPQQPIQPTTTGIMHSAPSEDLKMNKYHFLLVLERMQQDTRRVRPRGAWSFIPLGVFLTAMQSLITAEFKDAVGVTGIVWQSVTVHLAEAAALVTLGLLGWWVIYKCIHHDKSPEQMLNEITDQMAADR